LTGHSFYITESVLGSTPKSSKSSSSKKLIRYPFSLNTQDTFLGLFPPWASRGRYRRSNASSFIRSRIGFSFCSSLKTNLLQKRQLTLNAKARLMPKPELAQVSVPLFTGIGGLYLKQCLVKTSEDQIPKASICGSNRCSSTAYLIVSPATDLHAYHLS